MLRMPTRKPLNRNYSFTPARYMLVLVIALRVRDALSFAAWIAVRISNVNNKSGFNYVDPLMGLPPYYFKLYILVK